LRDFSKTGLFLIPKRNKETEASPKILSEVTSLKGTTSGYDYDLMKSANSSSLNSPSKALAQFKSFLTE
jgi:hypothetical protein